MKPWAKNEAFIPATRTDADFLVDIGFKYDLGQEIFWNCEKQWIRTDTTEVYLKTY